MVSMKKWMLGAALAAGTVAMTAVPAHAAEVHFGVYVGAPAAYVPPCPGPGYVWVDGYWSEGYWVPGYWNFVGGPAVGYGGPVYGFERGPSYRGDDDWRDRDDRWHDRDDHWRDRDDRGRDRDDHYRGDDNHYRGGEHFDHGRR